jgi:hypothetical protein
MYWYRRKRKGRMARLCGLVLEIGDEVVAVLGLLQATEGHLGAGNVLLGVLEVLELDERSADTLLCNLDSMQRGSWIRTYQSVVAPGDALALVGVGVSVSGDLTGLSAPESVKVGSATYVSI